MKRKNKIAGTAGAVGFALACGHAFAQSSVTLYGVADTSIRYVTHADSNNDGSLQMLEGPITGSRWGLKGAEDLGGGTAAIFNLESGFYISNGQLAQSANQLFGRMAYVGISNAKYGSITLGMQTTPLFDALGAYFDPLTIGNYNEDGWLDTALGYGLRENNSVKYLGQFGAMRVDAMYAFGNVPGSLGAGSMYGASVSYLFGALALDAGYQQNSDAANNKYRVGNLGAVYAFSTVKLYAGWMHSQDNTGGVDYLMADMSEAGAAQAMFADGLATGTDRIDDGFYAGFAWRVSTPLTVTGVAYYDRARNALATNDTLGTGRRYSAMLIAEYALSKRTEVYGTVDYMRGTGVTATADFPGSNNNTGVAVGLRTMF